jgi:uncharacterized membrane protein
MFPFFKAIKVLRDIAETDAGRRRRLANEESMRKERANNIPIVAIISWIPALCILAYGSSIDNWALALGGAFVWWIVSTLLIAVIISSR